MILNTGLDAACTTTANSGSSNSYPYFCEFIRYAAFGTGSTEPTVADTSLDAQVGSRSGDRGGFDNVEDGGVDPSTNTIWYESTFTRVFSIDTNVNATEWGLAETTSGNLSVRDLFRADPNDPGSSPVTLTLEDGDQLQLVVTLRVEATWEYETKSFVITGTAGNDTNGTHEGNATVSSGSSTGSAGALAALRSAWPGGYGTPEYLHAYLSDQSSVGKNADFPVNAGDSTRMADLAYNPGDHYRDATGVFSTSAANGDHYAWASTSTSTLGSSGRHRGYRFLLTDPPYLTKQNTHRLTLTLRRSISRL